MGIGIKKAIVITGILMLVILIVMIGGAVDVIQRGGGFLFVASFTPTSTNTATFTQTSTNTLTSTPTETFTPTYTSTLVPTATSTNVPTSTQTTVPTFDITALAGQIYNEVTRTYDAYMLMQTPSATPTFPPSELYTGLEMINPTDGKEILFVKNDDESDRYGFWIDMYEVSNREYSNCIHAGACTPPDSVYCLEKPYFNSREYSNFPVVNITFDQANDYCSWAGMKLMTFNEWKYAAELFQSNSDNIDVPLEGPKENGNQSMNLVGNVWEWISDQETGGYNYIAGGSWKTSVHDNDLSRTGRMRKGSYEEDIGFRCLLRICK